MGSVIPPTSFGRYELRRWLAHGGMSEVFVGVELDAGPDAAPVVVKRILPELGGDAQFVGMFINEAQLAAQMDHRNVVKVLEFGESEGRLFMVMEFVEGLDCWRFYRRMHDWGDDRDRLAIKIVHDVLSALQAATTVVQYLLDGGSRQR